MVAHESSCSEKVVLFYIADSIYQIGVKSVGVG